MTKEEAYSTVLEIRNIYIPEYKNIYRDLKDLYDFYSTNQYPIKEIYQHLMQFHDMMLINAETLFNDILKLIHEIE